MTLTEVTRLGEKPWLAVQVTLENIAEVCKYLRCTALDAKIKERDGKKLIWMVRGRTITVVWVGYWVVIHGENGEPEFYDDRLFNLVFKKKRE